LRVVGEMVGSDEIMSNTLFLGTYPGLTKAMLAQEAVVISAFIKAA
jgi:CDP-6-deoxy-D-xylo-4-hexulose-3-dehydrase